MELATLQLPMVLFTTLVPMASGAFIGLAIMFFTTHFSDACLKRIDLWTLLPIGITVVGFIAGVAFLADPRSAVTVFQGIDAGSMIVLSIIGSLLGFLSVVYWVIAGAGMLSYRPRMVFAAVLGASALVYSLAIGAIYVGSSVPTWNSVLVPIGMMGFCVAGGVPLGVLVVALAGGLPAARTTAFSTAAFAIALVGAVVAVFAIAAQLLFAQSIVSSALPGVDAVPGAWVYVALSVIGFIVMLASLRATLRPNGRSAAPVGRTAGAAAAMPYGMVEESEPVGVRAAVPLLLVSNVAVLAAIFVARMLFYALQV